MQTVIVATSLLCCLALLVPIRSESIPSSSSLSIWNPSSFIQTSRTFLLHKRQHNATSSSRNAQYFSNQWEKRILWTTNHTGQRPKRTLENKRIPTHLFPRGGSDYNGNSQQRRQGIPPLSSMFNTKSKNPTKAAEYKNSKSKLQSTRNSSAGRMYLACLGVVLIWIVTGTLFYSKYNNWPLPQSFFYAVDAGMSIGFCTDVEETTVGSRAFTIVYILLGASCVGGALFLFIKDIMEGLVEVRNDQFELLLARHAIMRLDPKDNYHKEEEVGKDRQANKVDNSDEESPSSSLLSHKDKLSYRQFRTLVEEWTNETLDDEYFARLCRRFDSSQHGYIPSETFLQHCHNRHLFLCTTNGPLYSDKWMVRTMAQLWQNMQQIWNGKHRIFAVLLLWITMGITWGVKRQGLDVITATHFAISALATGGLTGPNVDENGILPPEPAIFCGIFCLFGIPLFALTLGHFARLLVEEYVSAVEERMVRASIAQPLQVTEFEYAKHICTPQDPVIHLSDFIVLQLMRQNKVDVKLVELIKAQFEALDVDQTGMLHLEQATCMRNANNKVDGSSYRSATSRLNKSLQNEYECIDTTTCTTTIGNVREDLFILSIMLVVACRRQQAN